MGGGIGGWDWPECGISEQIKTLPLAERGRTLQLSYELPKRIGLILVDIVHRDLQQELRFRE